MSAFDGTYLGTIYYNTDDPIECDSYVFHYTSYYSTILYMPEKGAQKAREISPWKYFENIQAYEFTGIEGIKADSYDSPAEYYNLYGIRISDESLSPGLYIRKHGDKTEKILTK